MAAMECGVLAAAVEELEADGIEFALVHESALMGWGVDNNAFLRCVDAVLLEDEDFAVLGCSLPSGVGGYAEAEVAGVPVRLWSRTSLGLSGAVEVTSCIRYGCEALAPETVLRKLPFSPDFRLLEEQRACLAAIIHARELTDDELELVARYVRGV